MFTYRNANTDFDPGPGIYNLPLNAQAYNGFIQKLSPSGNMLWTKSLKSDSASYTEPMAIALDNTNNIYMIGELRGNADFDPGTGTFIINSGATIGVQAFINKLDQNGNFVWGRGIKRTDVINHLNFGYAIAIDQQNNVYTAGGYDNTNDFSSSPATSHTLTSGYNSRSIYVLKWG